ncbi:MAG TPA: aminotransferase class I/II-fold pyridoxal phosphate-dependent enzyme [Dermatophilaceae bacterium]|nr:aminotransferase class I/II-fold pyridoxal phosphate-dependent enzyme [Dermatophilaceae bacterium]
MTQGLSYDKVEAVIHGRTAAEIATSVRDLVASGALAAEAELPTVRALADRLGVNRNTVASAYAVLVNAGVAETGGRRGTRIAGIPQVPREIDWTTDRTTSDGADAGRAPAAGPGGAAGLGGSSGLVDLASGNPDPALLPSLATPASVGGYETVLYGDPTIDPGLFAWASEQLSPLLPDAHGLVVAHGAVDAIDRVLGTHLTRGDAVAVEDPCFLASIGMLRVNGYRPAPVATDEHGMVPVSLAEAISGGARAVVCTVRALNPTGASVPAQRAAELRAVLAKHPHVLVIEDDHFAGIATTDYHRVTPPRHSRWALVRSLSKFLGPDLRMAVVAADPDTTRRLETRLAVGATWVSRLLQHIAHQLLTDPAVSQLLTRAAATYGERRHLLLDTLRRRGAPVSAIGTDGLNVWIKLDQPAGPVVAGLAVRGWAVSDGGIYALTDNPTPALRVTVSTLTATRAAAFTDDLTDLITDAEHHTQAADQPEELQ